MLLDWQLNNIYNFFEKVAADEISMGGGEPFLNDFPRLCSGIKHGIRISVTTNGTICNEEIINKIIERNIKITISLDSLQPQYYNEVRKGLNFYKIIDTVQQLENIQEIQPNLSLRITINKYNVNQLTDIIDFCINNKISKLKVNTTNLYGRAKNNKDIVLDFHTFLDQIEEVKKYAKKYEEILQVELPVKKYLEKCTQKCTLGKNSLYLDPNGNIYPCAFSEKRLCLGNVYNENTEELALNIEKFSHDNSICQSCPIHRYENRK